MSEIATLDIIDRLPYEFQARLQADEFFCDIPVVVAEEGNIAAEIAKRQAVLSAKSTKRGVAVLVLQIVADDDRPNLRFGPMTLRPAFQVVENLELNRDANGTKKSARKVARRIRDVIKGEGLRGMALNIMPDKPCIEPVNLKKDLGDSINAYQVNFTCLEQGLQPMQGVEMPNFASLAPAPQFALSCPTPGATIFYTLDDSYPAAGNPSAIQCVPDEPIDIPIQPGAGPASVTVRACAYVPGMIASWVNRAVIVS